MKILVLSCGTGGHNSAAKAIVDELNRHNATADFIEYLDIINPRIRNLVNNLYIKSTTGNGRIFKRVYKLGTLYDNTNFKSPVYVLNSFAKKKLYEYIKSNNYDYIATTHLFAAQALTCIKKEHSDIHFIEICTDYTYIPFWRETNPDFIIVPHKDLVQNFEEKGVNRDKIVPIGIPVYKDFSMDLEKEKCYNELKLDKTKKYTLIMTGSMGFGNTIQIVDELSKRVNATNIVICGSNKKLQGELKSKYPLDKVIPIGFTNKISKYMRISNVLLTKPGGLTTTEAGTINIPIIHTMPIPGCENYNAEFFEKRGMSKKCNTIEEICEETQRLMNDDDLRNQMIENQKKYIDKETCTKICNLIINECNRI
jgi:processive 1,2-diacylglycerol beta-glucosyltransferase